MSEGGGKRRLPRRTGAELALYALIAAVLPAPAAGAPGAGKPSPEAEGVTQDVRRLVAWVKATGDARDLPFVVIDKISATVLAFSAGGLLLGSTPALLGAARGDVSPPGIGDRKLADIAPGERITPAGRFEAHLGRNLGPLDVLWVDYANAVSLHRVATGNPAEHRARRLATPSVKDNRISYGCINVPAHFYESVVQPLFKPANGIVYILPETRPLSTVFPIAATRARAGTR